MGCGDEVREWYPVFDDSIWVELEAGPDFDCMDEEQRW